MRETINAKLISMYVAAQCKMQEFFKKEDGDVNIVSIVVIIGIVILLAVVFKDAIGNLLKSMFGTIESGANDVINTPV